MYKPRPRSLFLCCLMSLCEVTLASANDVGDASNKTPSNERDGTPNVEQRADALREMQAAAIRQDRADWGWWGTDADRYSSWTSHSNRLIPVYTYGITLDLLRGQGSVYQSEERLRTLYGELPTRTLNATATYHDQTDIYRLQHQAADSGCRYIFLIVCDGMDWQTTRAAATYKTGKVPYSEGRGSGLAFLDYETAVTDFGLVVTSPRLGGARTDVDAQVVLDGNRSPSGGYDVARGGRAPWREQIRRGYLLGRTSDAGHTVTDSAASATSMTSGIKTYNGAINVAVDGTQVEPIAAQLQRNRGFKIGVVTSVPVSHATPAAAYAHNVSRKDYQDITRDLLGLPSSSHRQQPLEGVDVLIGAGWGEAADVDRLQGSNYLSGNPYLHQSDIRRSDVANGGRYVVAERAAGQSGVELLRSAADRAAKEDLRLLGFFGTRGGHLPFRTADGGYNPAADVRGTETYDSSDRMENPSLAEMTSAALKVLAGADEGFWLMIEAGDVDWANHANNVDNSVGAVLSAEAAFGTVVDWIEQHQAWDETAVILTADHGHYLVLNNPEPIAEAGRTTRTDEAKE